MLPRKLSLQPVAAAFSMNAAFAAVVAAHLLPFVSYMLFLNLTTLSAIDPSRQGLPSDQDMPFDSPPKQRPVPLAYMAGQVVRFVCCFARNISQDSSGYHSRVESDRAEAAAIAADSVSAAATGV